MSTVLCLQAFLCDAYAEHVGSVCLPGASESIRHCCCHTHPCRQPLATRQGELSTLDWQASTTQIRVATISIDPGDLLKAGIEKPAVGRVCGESARIAIKHQKALEPCCIDVCHIQDQFKEAQQSQQLRP